MNSAIILIAWPIVTGLVLGYFVCVVLNRIGEQKIYDEWIASWTNWAKRNEEYQEAANDAILRLQQEKAQRLKQWWIWW